MALVQKCDVCNKPVGDKPIAVGRSGIFDSVHGGGLGG